MIQLQRVTSIPAIFTARSRAPAAAAAPVSWWLSGGASGCRAAYQPKGAASYALSKVNLANPGTYDLSDGVNYPSWNTAIGWTHATQYLYSDTLDIGIKPCSYLVRLTTLNQTDYRTVIGGDVDGGLSLDLTPSTNLPRFLKMNMALIGSGTAGFAASTDTVIGITYSGAGVWTHYLNGVANGTGTNDQTPIQSFLEIGGQNVSGAVQPYTGDIAAVAIYDNALDSTQFGSISAAMAVL